MWETMNFRKNRELQAVFIEQGGESKGEEEDEEKIYLYFSHYKAI